MAVIIDIEARLKAKLASHEAYSSKLSATNEAIKLLALAVAQMQELGLSSEDIARLFRFSANEIGGKAP